MSKVSVLAASLALALLLSMMPARAEPRVLASVKPIHSLVAAIMRGVGEPGLLLHGAGSPHSFSLSPSQAVQIERAELIFWIGHELESFLEKPLETIGANARTVELIDASGLIRLAFREGGAFDGHGQHADDDHDEHDNGEHEHDEHENTEQEHDEHENSEHEHGEDDHAAHDEGAHAGFDPHVWLDPQNAKHLSARILEVLIEEDAENRHLYETNAQRLAEELDTLTMEVEALQDPVREQHYIVFHDAYQYFERRFGISASGSITVNPDTVPGVERIREMQERVRETEAVCVFAEPQFEPKLIAIVSEGTNAKSAVLDPLGAGLDPGPDLYASLIHAMAGALHDCLSEGLERVE